MPRRESNATGMHLLLYHSAEKSISLRFELVYSAVQQTSLSNSQFQSSAATSKAVNLIHYSDKANFRPPRIADIIVP